MTSAVIARLVFWLWFGAAVLAGHFLLLTRIPLFVLQSIALVLTALLLTAYFRVRPVREWVDGFALRALVLLHLTRFVGFYFITLYQRGELPRSVAVPAGLGDIIVAALALPVVFAPLTDATRLRAIVIWNVVGFVDILLVLFNAALVNITGDPAQLRAFSYLPLSLLPTFLVPLILATHVIIFARAARAQR